MQLEFLSNLVSQFTNLYKQKRNLIEIAGYPSWENVNSNILAFYIDKNEEHNFGSLFFDTIFEIIQNDPEFSKCELHVDLFSSEYVVHREYNFIDLVLHSTNKEGNNYSWAILIENKIYHVLNNDLKSYWERVDAKNKIGIVLTLNPIERRFREIDGVYYFNVTHNDLVERLKLNLTNYSSSAEQKHLHFIQDYFLNIESFYPSTKNLQVMNDNLNLYQKNFQDIKKLHEIENQLYPFVVKEVIEVFRNYGFFPYTESVNADSKHFFHYPDFFISRNLEIPKHLRFYVSFPSLTQENKLLIYLELFDESVKYGDSLKKELLKHEASFPKGLRVGNNGGEKYQYYHMLVVENFEIRKPEDTKTLREALEDSLKCMFFDRWVNFCAVFTNNLENDI